jgi:hypothetical protein
VTDAEDFYAALEEYGVTPQEVRIMSECDNRIPMPPGGYKFTIDASGIEGWGVFASGEILAGEVIAPARVSNLRTVVGRFTNHGARPNALMVLQPNGNLDLVAIYSIRRGDEITIDYRQSMQLSGLKRVK